MCIQNFYVYTGLFCLYSQSSAVALWLCIVYRRKLQKLTKLFRMTFLVYQYTKRLARALKPAEMFD